MSREPERATRPDRRPRRERQRRLVIQILGLAAILALAGWANLYAAQHDIARELAQRLGYAGIFAAAALSGFNLLVPVPVVAFFGFFMEVGFRPVPTVLVIATGMTVGDLVGYILGRTTREVMEPRARGLVQRLEGLRERRPLLPFVVMFLYAAFAPIPNEILVIPLAFLRYPVLGVLAAVLGGNLIFNSLVAFGVVEMLERL